MNERQKSIESLKKYFLEKFVEDPINGTVFDGSVLNALEVLSQQFSDEPVEVKKNRLEEIEKLLGRIIKLAEEIADLTDKTYPVTMFIDIIKLAQKGLIGVEFVPVD